MSPKAFQESQKNTMATQQLLNALQNSAFSLEAENKNHLNLKNQTRDISYLTITDADVKSQLAVNDEDLQNE